MFWRITTFFAVWLCATAGFAKDRVWISSDGRTMTAEFVRELDGDVTFRKDGKLVIIRLEKLSPQDQQLVKDLSSGKVTESETPASNGSTSSDNDQAEGKSGKAKKPAIQTRTWTDRFGIKSSGKFVRVDGSDVVISRGNRVLTVPFFNLSENDQQYVRLVLISQGNEDLIPTESTGPSGNGIEGGGVGGGGAIAGGGIAGGGIGGAGFPGGAIPPGIGGPGMAGPGIGPGRGMGMPGIAGGAGFPGAGPMRGPGMSSGIGDPAGRPGGGAGALPPGIAGGPMGAGIGGGIGGPGGPGIGRMAPPDLGPGMASAPPGMMPGMGNTGIGGPGMASGLGSMPGSSFPSSATAGSSMPPSMMPGMAPASIPPIPERAFSSPVFEQSFQCSGCGAKISQAESSLSKCPHCGITWGYKQDAFGNKTMTSSGGKLATAGIVILIFVFLGVIVFFALFVGIIVAVVRAASSSARPPQPQRYY